MADVKTADDNVFLFYPNLIGYGRIVLAVVACFFMLDSPAVASFCYGLSAFLDAFDGYLARMYNQSSRFGAMLDQLTDRLAFVGLLMALCALYPRWMFFFQLVVIIDIASHWLHLHATDLTGKQSHKSSENPLLHYYYTSRPFLFFMCFGNEAFYGFLYLNAFWTGPNLLLGITPMKILMAPFCVVAIIKTGISIVHLLTASQAVVEHDQSLRAKAK